MDKKLITNWLVVALLVQTNISTSIVQVENLKCLQNILSIVLTDSQQNILVSISPNLDYQFQAHIQHTLLSRRPIVIESSSSTNSNHFDGIDIIILFEFNSSEISKTLKRWHLNNNPLATVLLFFTNVVQESKAHQILKVFHLYKMLDVYIVTGENYNRKIITWFPFDIENDCGNVIRKLKVISCNAMFIRDKHPRSYAFCPLKVAGIQTTPFLVYENKMFKGLDVKLILAISKKLQLRPQLKLYRNKTAHVLTDRWVGTKSWNQF